MSEETVAPVAPGAEVAPVLSPASEPQALNPREAASALSKWRDEQAKALETPKEPAAPEKAAAEQPIQDAAQETAPGETEAQDTATELPPIEPPRSWSKEDKELFGNLPRTTQENLVERERSRERDFLRRQNEVTEKAKALEAEVAAAQKARQEYENAYPGLVETVRTLQSGAFADIKSHADAQNLAQSDPARYVQYLAHQQGLAQMEADARAIQERNAQDQRSRWQTFASREDKALLDVVPELAEPEVLEKTSKAALKTLKDIGFPEDELAKAWNGEMAISPRDHRFQVLVYEATKYREAKAGIAKPTAKPVPPVQKPGTATSRADQAAVAIDSAKKKLANARGVEAARAGLDLLRAQRAARGG